MNTTSTTRPPLLNPLFAEVTNLTGIGPRIAQNLSKLLVTRDVQPGIKAMAQLRDLVFHMPHNIVDRRQQPALNDAPLDTIVTLKLQVDEHYPSPRGNASAPYRVKAHDVSKANSFSGECTLVFFRAHQSWLEKQLPIGEVVYVSGKLEAFNDQLNMVHPDHIVLEENFDDLPLVEPIYPLGAGVSAKILQKAIKAALEKLPKFPEWQDAPLLAKQKWPTFNEALSLAHDPQDGLDVSPQCIARQRLAYDELLAGQLALALVRANMKKQAGRALKGDGKLTAKITKHIPFELTGAQQRALGEIKQDMGATDRMLRLLQGDVGSGKTVVALLAMVNAIEAGAQGAIMAPTEILARQHYASIKPLAEAVGLNVAILTGREKGKTRENILEGIAKGNSSQIGGGSGEAFAEGDGGELKNIETEGIDILIGTHALIQPDLKFKNLGLGIIDEQHRFGVQQRLALSAKGQSTDILVMTATPIPRTLVLTFFGDMDVSILDEKPAGRQPITTTVLAKEKMADLVARLQKAIASGKKAYWICPLVEESEALPVTAVQTRYESLLPVFGDKLGLVHGKMKPAEKDAVMADFKAGKIKLLIATTVIEVGVDVSDATIMIIEHAERFGLAQLHQLRGRVGRGSEASSCILLYQQPLGQVARERLNIMRESEDGFFIAEQDLKLRGEGEILGTQQSGLAKFQMADLEHHGALLEIARKDARMIAQTNQKLEGERGEALRHLLYLFNQDSAIKLIRAG